MSFVMPFPEHWGDTALIPSTPAPTMMHMRAMTPTRAPEDEAQSAEGQEEQEQRDQWCEAAKTEEWEGMPKAISVIWIGSLPVGIGVQAAAYAVPRPS